MVRKAIVAGQFYAADKKELENQIESSFLSELGPGKLSESSGKNKVIGIISPHAGYMFSGAGAAWSYKEIFEAEEVDTYILIGLSHNGYETCLSNEDWETPLGRVEVDKEFQEEILKRGVIKQDEKAQQYEHSIEVQIPFLQYVSRIKNQKIKIAPIIASQDMDFKVIADEIFRVIKKLNRRVIIIASSDFTHFGASYGYFPFSEEIKNNMKKLDMGAINLIEKLESEKFLDYVNETKATICGKYPISVLIELAKKLGANKGKLLRYYTSADIVGDYSSAVGYAAIKIE
jgi:hypothetical protein